MNLLFDFSISALNEDILDAKLYLILSLYLVGYRRFKKDNSLGK